jgi:nucleotide-binding universal stress UspA family protein
VVKRIVVATDFSQDADRALALAIGFAKRLRGTVDLVHVYRLPAPIASSIAGAAAPSLPSPGDVLDANRQLGERAELVRSAGVDCRAASLGGEAAVEIASLARKIAADLIVMGRHGRRGLRKWMSGSVTESVLRKAGSPVLVVPSVRDVRG